jgi:heterodisulfide reductase subunit B
MYPVPEAASHRRPDIIHSPGTHGDLIARRRLLVTEHAKLSDRIAAETGENVFKCYQCQKCTVGCPVADEMDVKPNRVLRLLQYGRDDAVLRSKTIWVCAQCQTCVTRCPHNIDLPRMMDVAKQEAVRRHIPSPLPMVPIFNDAGSRQIRMLGRMYELGLIGELKLRGFAAGERDLGPLKDEIRMGIRLFAAGKLSPIPEIIRPSKPQPSVGAEAKPKRIGYFPGCSLHATGIEYNLSTHSVANKLGLELAEPKGWLCCGSTPAHATDHLLATRLPIHNLGLISQQGDAEATMPCAACYSRFRTAVHDVNRDEHLRKKVAEEVGFSYDNQVKVSHLLDTFLDKVGLDAITGAVTRPLANLKVVCYYGCLLTRPSRVTMAEHPEYPMRMDKLASALGAQSLDWGYKTECCGSNLALTKADTAMRLSEKILRNAQDVGADAVVVACSLCHVNLDTRQDVISRAGRAYNLPIVYFTQLMGLAMGMKPEDLGMQKHLTNPLPLMRAKGF